VCGSGGVAWSSCLLIRWAQRASCQAETPLIVLCRFPGPALSITGGHGDENYLAPQFAASNDGVANGVEGVTAKVRQTSSTAQT
jgi:hypothetical protein